MVKRRCLKRRGKRCIKWSEKKKRKKTVVIVNVRRRFGEKDYRIVDKKATTPTKLVLASQQSYATIKDARDDAKFMGFRISREW